MKSRIFIGSSTESKTIAERVMGIMEPEFECELWAKDFFEINIATYDNLVQKAPSFDYAIFIGGTDDTVFRMREEGMPEKKLAPRDNVYLEFALYGGILSVSRSFFMLDEKCKVASDLNGVTLFYYNSQRDSIEKCCEQLKSYIHEEEKINRIRLLPSTSLAIGYYRNFIEQLMNCLKDRKEIYVGKEKIKLESQQIKLNIMIPGDVETDWKKWEQMYALEKGLKNAMIQSISRPMAFMLDPLKLEQENRIEIIDVPQTVRVAFQAVEMTMKKDYIGDKSLITKTKQKEVVNFINTLRNLMKEDPFASKYVVICPEGGLVEELS